MKLFSSLTTKLQREYEARLFIDLLQPHIVKLSFNFASNEETRKIIWSFYNLKCSYKKNAFWKRQGILLSSNEKCICTLMNFEFCSPVDDPFLSPRKNRILLRFVRKYSTIGSDFTVTMPNIKERFIYLNSAIL